MDSASSADKTTHDAAILQDRVRRQLATYWRVRVNKTIERFEHEARRMLNLEKELAEFADDYYATVGEAASRLSAIEAQLMQVHATNASLNYGVDEVAQYRETREQRAAELKTRYRRIAKEIHPDRAMIVEGAGARAATMQTLNEAYQRSDLAALLALQAQLQLTKLCEIDFSATALLESALHEVNRAADTYAQAYRNLLNSPMNELMLKHIAAAREGWDFSRAVATHIERQVDEKMAEFYARSEGHSVANPAPQRQRAPITFNAA